MYQLATAYNEKPALDRFERADDVIFALARAVEAKDAYTGGHLFRMASYVNAIGIHLGAQGDELTALRHGAFLHDIGKVGIDDCIIRKPGPLTSAERAVMQQHVIIGQHIVQPLRLGVVVGPIVRHHHERWDGSGYPDGLAGEDIPLGARIVAVADAFDAMTTQRPYNQVVSRRAAIARLRAGAGIFWDVQIVRIFVDCVDAVCRTFTRAPQLRRQQPQDQLDLNIRWAICPK